MYITRTDNRAVIDRCIVIIYTGMVAGDFDPVNQSAFVVEYKAFVTLPCPCHVRAH